MSTENKYVLESGSQSSQCSDSNTVPHTVTLYDNIIFIAT